MLINPMNTINRNDGSNIHVVKEEALEESIEKPQIKKNSLKIIIPENSIDEMEPSTSGSSNVKVSPNTIKNSPKKLIEKNKFTFDEDEKNNMEEMCKVTGHFLNNENNFNFSFRNENNNIRRPETPSALRYKNILCHELKTQKNIERKKFNYDFETKKNGVIVPLKKKINKEKLNTIQKNDNKDNSRSFNKYKKTITKNNQKIRNQKPMTPINKRIKMNSFNTYEKKDNGKNTRNNTSRNKKDDKVSKLERKKSNSVNKKSNTNLPYLPQNKIISVKNKLEDEINSLIDMLPNNYEVIPEYKNKLDSIFKDIYKFKKHIYNNIKSKSRKKENNI